ncbi:MAG: trans-sulfuration enzyme family protein [Gemmatimonadota bacterium]
MERKLAALERGEACKCFGSGMAAISAVLLAFLHAGDHVLFVNHTYGPTLQLAESLRRLGIQYDRLLDLDAAAVEAALRPETRLVRLESPGTMLFRVLDLEAVAGLARERGIPTCIDNSWATPLCQKPLAMGIDLVVHTCTKYLGGHSDLVAGAVMGSEERIAEIFERTYLLLGGILGPFEAWLLLRGAAHPPCPAPPARGGRAPGGGVPARHRAVRRVFPPAFAEERALVERQLSGYSGLLSFELAGGDFEDVRRVIDALRVPRIGVSWGGVESLVLSPNRGTNGPWLDAQGIPRGLIRLSVGLEGAEVLIEDLGQALATRS